MGQLIIVAAVLLIWILKIKIQNRRLLSGYDQVSAYAKVLELELKHGLGDRNP